MLARIAEVEREQDALRSANPAEGLISVIMERERAARADAARLAEALRGLHLPSLGQYRRADLVQEVVEALAAHDAGTPTGGVWLTAEEAESLRGLLDYSSDDVEEQARPAFVKLRKARGGGA
jgi:hypothetical protein